MKPICATCNLFFQSKTNGVYFEEGMPGPGAARRELVPLPLGTTIDQDLYPSFINYPTRVKPGPLDGWESYKLWVGDLWQCPGCGAEIIVGVPPNPIREHYQADYQEMVAKLGAERRIDDC